MLPRSMRTTVKGLCKQVYHVSGQISTTYINHTSPSHVLDLPEVTVPTLKTSAEEEVEEHGYSVTVEA
jgi:hypothetical protein